MTAITPFPIWWSITRRMGFSAYLVTSIFCFLVWLRARRRLPGSGFAHVVLAVAVTELVLCLDMIFEWRLAIHDLFASVFGRHDLYGRRHPVQEATLIILGCALVLVVGGAIRRFSWNRGRLVAVFGVSMSLTLYLIEIISMHEMDSGLYYFFSNVMVIAFLWVLACALTLTGIAIEARMVLRRV